VGLAFEIQFQQGFVTKRIAAELKVMKVFQGCLPHTQEICFEFKRNRSASISYERDLLLSPLGSRFCVLLGYGGLRIVGRGFRIRIRNVFAIDFGDDIVERLPNRRFLGTAR
jgi:hypothetical protein